MDAEIILDAPTTVDNQGAKTNNLTEIHINCLVGNNGKSGIDGNSGSLV